MKYKYDSIENIQNLIFDNNNNFDEIYYYTIKFLYESNFKYKYLINLDIDKNRWKDFISSQILEKKDLLMKYSKVEILNKFPLFGVPLIVKDNINIKGFITSSGSKYFIDNIAKESSYSVKLLQNLGCIVVAKANLSEFAGGTAQFGLSELGDKTINTFNNYIDPSGSSSGSAAATALGFPMALGSETFGSILFPAFMHNVIGWKPSQDLLTRDANIIPLNNYFDTIGLIINNYKNFSIISNALVKNKSSKKILNVAINESHFYNFIDNSHIVVEPKQLKALLKRFGDYLTNLGHNITYINLDMNWHAEVAHGVDTIFLKEIDRDFKKWNDFHNLDYVLNDYLKYAFSLPNHIKWLGRGNRNADISKEHQYARLLAKAEALSKYDVVIGNLMLGTFISAVNKNPAITIPLKTKNFANSISYSTSDDQILKYITSVWMDFYASNESSK